MADEGTEAPPAEGDQQTTIPAFPSGGDTPAETLDIATIIPDAYKDKAWVKNIKDSESLFKMVDDQNAALGKRPAGIPEDNATDEQRALFNKAFGVPEKSEEYKLPDLVEGDTKGAEFQTKIKAMYHKAELNPRQANVISEMFGDLAKSMAPDSEAQDAEFSKMMDAEFGDQTERVLKEAQELITRFTPESMKDEIDKLGNVEQKVLASVLKGIRDEYISEDDIPSGPGAAAATPADKIEEAKAIMMDMKDPYNDEMNPNYGARREYVNKLFGTHVEK